VVQCGDIAEASTAQRLVAAATATGLPLRGVLHAAAAVEDATLTDITDELIDRDWAPKVYGAWNLHTATATQPLDWFCSFSSAAALLGSPGQGAYAAANSWLDSFTHWRRAHSRFAEVFQSNGQTRTGTSKFRTELNALPLEEWPTRLRRLVSGQVGLILRRSVDPDRPLSEYGLDSLGCVELRTRIETETGIRIAPTDITTVRGLAEHLSDTLVDLEAYRRDRPLLTSASAEPQLPTD
jgi:acyl carrier protein